MAEAFDPYRKWLGIPPSEQPPDHYRLLGVARFESDPDVIANAADRQMAHVRRYQSGKYSNLSQQILNELSAARVCLLDAQKREAYDRGLREKLAVAQPVAQAAPVAPTAPPPPPRGGASAPPIAGGSRVPELTTTARAPGAGATAARRYAARRRKGAPWAAIAAVGALVVVLIVLAVVALGPWESSSSKDNGAQKTGGDAKKAVASKEKTHDGTPTAKKPKGPKETEPGTSIKVPSPKPGGVPEKKPTVPVTPPSPGPIHTEPGFVGQIREIPGHAGRVSSVAFSPTYPFILSGGEDRTVRRWSASQGDVLSNYEGAKAPIRAVAFSPDGLQIVAAGDAVEGQNSDGKNGLVYFWEVGGRPLPLLNLRVPDSGTVHALAYSRDGKLIALASDDEIVRLVDPNKPGQKQLRQFPEPDPETYERDRHQGPVLGVAFSPDATYLVSAGADSKAFVWETATAKKTAQFTGHSGPVHSVACLVDGQHVLSASEDKTICLWELKTGKLVQRFTGHTAAVTCVAASPDGTRALSGSHDGTLRLWDLAGRKTVRVFSEHQGPVCCVAFSPGGLEAVSGGEDGIVRLWKLPAPDESGPSGKPAPRAAPPPADALKAARAKIRNELFPAEFAKADNKALAQRLLSEGSLMGQEPELAYGMLVMSSELSAGAGDIEGAFTAIDRLSEQFQTDDLGLRVEALQRAAEAPNATASARAGGTKILEILDAMAEQKCFDHLDTLDALRPKLISRRTDPELNKLVVARLKELGDLKGAWEAIAQARETLRQNPDDPQANEAVGRYYCLRTGQWEKGLPMLAKAADALLREAAAADLASPEDPQAQLALADQWWAVAEGEAGDGRQRIRLRAAHWYQKAEPGLSDAAKAKAGRRIEEARSSGPQGPGTLGPPSADGLECRESPLRQAFLDYYGGNAATETAVDRGLQWLADHQRSDGSWSFNHEDVEPGEKSANPGTLTDATIGPTALALLPFLGANHTPRQGVYRENARRGIGVLLTRVNATGNLYEPDAAQFPSHPLGTIALCEACTLYRDKITRAAAQRAVQFALLVQNDDGGWSFRIDTTRQKPEVSHLLATGWYAAALTAGQRAGFPVPADAIRKARQFIESCRSDDGSGFLFQPGGGDPDRLATAVGYYSLMLVGADRDLSGLADYAAQLEKDGPSTRGEFLFNFVAANLTRDYSSDTWQSWNTPIRDHLLASQGTAGAGLGSWYLASGEWGNRPGGRLLTTALATLTLEVYYRHPPLYPDAP